MIPGFDPWVGKRVWTREWQPTPVFLPGEFHGQRSLAGYSPYGHKESDMTKATEHACTVCTDITHTKNFLIILRRVKDLRLTLLVNKLACLSLMSSGRRVTTAVVTALALV